MAEGKIHAFDERSVDGLTQGCQASQNVFHTPIDDLGGDRDDPSFLPFLVNGGVVQSIWGNLLWVGHTTAISFALGLNPHSEDAQDSFDVMGQ